jgi:endogenous inhibitor of DNA gyrase (YacG/DUF329 family)
VSPLGKKLRAKVRGERQRHAAIVADVARILDAGRSSKFEFEAACRTGLRSGFCLEGRTWKFADAYAAAIVKEALRKLGAERPTWWQGQPEWTQDGFAPIDYYYCQRCGKPIPEDRKPTAGQALKFCSKLCSDVVAARRSAISGERLTMAERLAAWAAQSKRTMQERSRHCDHCGRYFLTKRRDRKFCSPECQAKGQIRHREVPCAVCGKPFRQQLAVQSHKRQEKGLTKYCSLACTVAARKRRATRTCPVCGEQFPQRSSSAKTQYCSRRCQGRATGFGSKTGFACEAAE